MMDVTPKVCAPLRPELEVRHSTAGASVITLKADAPWAVPHAAAAAGDKGMLGAGARTLLHSIMNRQCSAWLVQMPSGGRLGTMFRTCPRVRGHTRCARVRAPAGWKVNP
ncbi:hypothetical protein EON67_12020 [archaeon]|nr:MAG: hypothetical protein EON67_12020 [archaeon]